VSRATRLGLVLAAVLAARPAAAERVTVKVVDVAGTTAYVEPGGAAGIVAGTRIRFGRRELVVTDATDKTAAVTLAGASLAIGATGTAEASTTGPELTKKLPPPRPLGAFRDQWPAPVLPATTQQVRAIPLGGNGAGRGTHLAVYGHLYGNLDRDGSGGQLEARVVGSFALMHDRPLGADLDGAIRLYGTGANGAERVPVFVRAAQVRWGDPADPSLVLGRLRYAATSLGMLDGGRAAMHTGNLELAAFGGVVPDPISGRPDTGASRFGGELIYERPTMAWRPRVAVVAHGSTWQGQLDERRLSITASASKGATWLDGWLEAQQFASDNPWGAPAVDITGAGASGDWRHRGNHLGLDVTFLRPERSLRLEAALPPDWQCARAPQPGDVPEACLGSDFWAAATASAGLRRRLWSLDAVASIGGTQGVGSSVDASGYLRGELGSRRHRLVLGVSGGHAPFAAWIAGDIGVAVAPTPRLDASLTYRPEQLDYIAALGPYVQHSLVTDVHWAARDDLGLALSAVGTTGADRDVLALLATIAWRPLP